MKTKIARYTQISLFVMFTVLLQAMQVNAQHQKGNSNQGKQPGNRHANIEAQRVAFITQELMLTPAEAQVFWPVYNEYDAKRHELKKSFKNSDDLHKAEIENLTEKEANQALDNQIIAAEKLLDLRKEYHAKFKAVLPAVKVLKLYDAEREFQRVLIDRLRSKKSPPPSIGRPE